MNQLDHQDLSQHFYTSVLMEELQFEFLMHITPYYTSTIIIRNTDMIFLYFQLLKIILFVYSWKKIYININ